MVLSKLGVVEVVVEICLSHVKLPHFSASAAGLSRKINLFR